MQVVVFSIEKSYFAINTNVVQSINNTMKVTKVPKSSKFIKGLINIRGSIKTLVNINLILDVAENSPKENIMILSLKEEDIAIEVDFVKEVLEIEEKDVEKAHNNIRKVQNIIGYLQSTLDTKYPVAQDFINIYDYLFKRLLEANVKKDKEILEEINMHLHSVRDNWKEVMRINREKGAI